jgi:hypothetical protein
LKKNKRNIILLGIVAVLGFFIYSQVSPTVPSNSAILNGVNIADYFAPFSTLSLTGTPAPAISCSITNNVGMKGTDYSIYTVSTATPIFQPTYQQLINPYNGATASTEIVKIFLYCDPSPASYAKYGDYPYLVGGSVTIQFNAKESQSGYQRVVSTSVIQVNPVDANGNPLSLPTNFSGKSIQIATVTIPVSSIQSVILPTSTDFYSLQQVVTTGNLVFKMNPANTITATHQISPLYTSFSYLSKATVKATPSPTPSTPTTPTSTTINCPTGTIPINGVCSSITQSITMSPTSFDRSKSDSIPYKIIVNGWASNQPYPNIRIDATKTTSTPFATLKTFNLNSAPNSYSNNVATWNGVLSIKNDLGANLGIYRLEVSPVSVSGVARLVADQEFTVTDSTVPTSAPTNPSPTIQTKVGTGSIQFFYNAKYDAGYTDNGIVPKNGYSINFSPQNLIASSTSGKMYAFSMATQMTVTDQNFANLNIVSSQLTHTGTITVQGYGTIPLSNSELNGVVVNARQSSGQAAIYTFDNISIDPLLIDGKISQLAPPQLISSIPVNVEIDTSGNFVLADSNGKQYNGVISGGVFTYGTNFGTIVNAPVCTPDQTAQGFTPVGNTCTPPASSPNVCTSSQSASGYTIVAGVCTPPQSGTPNSCTSTNGTVITCPPTGSPTPYCQLNPTVPACNPSGTQVGGKSNGTSSASGGAAICPAGTSIQDCLTALSTQISNLQNGNPTNLINNNIFAIALAGILIIGIIIYAVRKRR